MPNTIVMYAKNQAVIMHAGIEGVTVRTKQFDIRLKHARDLQHKGIVGFTYTRSTDNTADIPTKDSPYQDTVDTLKDSV